jgi:hypothetical protein
VIAGSYLGSNDDQPISLSDVLARAAASWRAGGGLRARRKGTRAGTSLGRAGVTNPPESGTRPRATVGAVATRRWAKGAIK